MFRTSAFHAFFLLFWGAIGLAQISPGDLTNAHAKLEGMSNCTQCHVLGEKVSNTKCLECHTEIQSLLRQDDGLHANPKVRRQDCFECHSEHHGRNFDMVRFNEKSFDHDLAGYSLEGKHATVDCRECHQPENIQNSDLRRRKGTYLGLDQKCLSCHNDYHQESLSNDCLACHTMQGFDEAPRFDHNEAQFPLRGKHAQVDCKECHEVTTRNGQPFQKFEDIAFADCVACHQDPHQGQLPGTCTQCHNESSFATFTGNRNFNHNQTGFKLKGSHNTVNCFTCHSENNPPSQLFQEKTNIAETNCASCHSDPHDNKFGQDCAKCHNEESFLALNNMDFFDHSITAYPLEGMHKAVDCRECHTERFSTPIDFSECKNCHQDYHNGEFMDNGVSPDCATCHSVERGFEFTLFTVSDHQQTSFPLEGAHVATPCFACHVSEESPSERWSFVNMGDACVDCHIDIHEGSISARFYPENDCTACHVNEAWNAVTFDHSTTDWPLSGKHKNVSCRECHFEMVEPKTIISQNFSNLNTDCASCHENVHEDAFAINGVTDCNRCHVTSSWLPEKFDHSKTRFPLSGRHAAIDCRECHETTNNQNQVEVVYKLNTLECADCHLQ
ncbi:MAG: cytochrome c family protein [Flavobacteriaceae bacterium]|nr:cytochrome c family protein [Flavobacteriaceae bacterium]